MKSVTAIDFHLSEVPCVQVGVITDDLYSIPAVYQRIFNPMTKKFALIGRQLCFLSILMQTARFCGKWLQNDGIANFVQFFLDQSVYHVLI